MARPPFFLHPEELVDSSPLRDVDPLGSTARGRSMTHACGLLVEALRADSTCPEELKARVRAARTADEIEAVVEELAQWNASREAP